MLAIQYQSSFSWKKFLVVITILLALGSGLYVASLFNSPAIAHAFFSKPIVVRSLPAPNSHDDRLIIPKLGIDITYSTSASSLTMGAQWRQSDLGNPDEGGLMLLAAHYLSIQPTPQQTVARSPFYALGTLTNGDKLIVDYGGVRYGYEVTTTKSGPISDTPIPTDTANPRLVLYTHDTDDDAVRTIVSAKPLGKVSLDS